MAFAELNRSFFPLLKDHEPSLDFGRVWGRKLGGWLEWSDLRERRRVVLLAEASSGKSEEFKNQVKQLNAEDKAAFYLPIEELADQGFEAALDAGAAKRFEKWSNGTDEAWFFLDSIDEARLNRKSFDSALKRFARELGVGIERACIFISCRVTDWKGLEDRETITQWLPAWEAAKASPTSDESALLDPIFDKKQKSTRQADSVDKKPNELLVIQLVPLSAEQYRALAKESGVTNLNGFIDGIDRNGLEAFAERPGDLLDLADYWKTHKQFGRFAEMVEHGITRKMRERDTHRRDNETLSLAKAREGAARLAAALSFGKSFTLRAPNHDPDPSLAVGALDASLILIDWNEAQCNAVLRRGVFAPATYGRIRFHHRSTQEYLTAKWLDGLLAANCPLSEIWRLLFVDRYGVDPDMGVSDLAAWLSGAPPESRRARAEQTLGKLFDRHDSFISGALARASVSTLERLLQTAYEHIRPEQDAVHEGSYSPDDRDRAEGARNTILSALLDRPGADAYRAMLRAAGNPDFAIRSERFRELARGKAERDAEYPSWTIPEVITFETQYMAPVKTGADLMRLVSGVLDDINFQLTKGDSTSRQLLERANDEDEVQQWLAEQIQSRSRGRYHAYREAQVARGDKPDVIVASAAAQCEVAVEVKHGGKGWTANQLEQALRVQLAINYLKPATRRHGVLVITHHRDRQWLDPLTSKRLPFDAVIKWLSDVAATLMETDSGAIEVKCFGINAWRGTSPTSKDDRLRSPQSSNVAQPSSPRRTVRRRR
jgi:hypothetical protein